MFILSFQRRSFNFTLIFESINKKSLKPNQKKFLEMKIPSDAETKFYGSLLLVVVVAAASLITTAPQKKSEHQHL